MIDENKNFNKIIISYCKISSQNTFYEYIHTFQEYINIYIQTHLCIYTYI